VTEKPDEIMAMEIEVDEGAEIIPTEYEPPRPSLPVKNDTEEVSLERFRSGYNLVRTVFYVIGGVYITGITYGLIMAFVHQPSAMDIKEFSLEVIRLLIPPLTFILGFMFGAKERE